MGSNVDSTMRKMICLLQFWRSLARLGIGSHLHRHLPLLFLLLFLLALLLRFSLFQAQTVKHIIHPAIVL